MESGNLEHRHDRVTDVLLHGPAVLLDDGEPLGTSALPDGIDTCRCSRGLTACRDSARGL